MRKIFKVFKRDIRNIIKNPAAIIIMIGLFFIPSLYAWVNIKACWNPYVNTGNLPIAVVNNDSGTTVNGKNINIGNDIVEELKKNDKIGWKFVGDWQGNYGLNEGDYYALIEIPSDFSKDLTTLATSHPERPNIIYKANQKANAIATKIAEVAKGNLVEQIKSNFIDTVNKEIFKYLNTFGVQLDKNKPKILELKNILDKSENSLNDIQNYLSKVNNDSENLQGYLKNVRDRLPTITNQIDSLQNITSSNKDLINSTKTSLNNIINGLKNDLLQLQMVNNRYSDLLNSLKSNNLTTKSIENGNKAIDEMKNILSTTNTIIENDKNILNAINKKKPLPNIERQIQALNTIQNLVGTENSKLDELRKLVNENKFGQDVDNVINNLQEINSHFRTNLTNTTNTFYNNTVSEINSVSNFLNEGNTIANNVLESSKIIVPQLNALINFGISSGELASSQIGNVSNKVSDLNGKVKKVQDETKGITNDSLNEMITMMQKNPDVIASFMSSPIEVKEVEVYDTGIFGVALTPFYTVLGIWVGILLMLALLTTECEDFEDGEKVSIIQKHFGKMLLFMSIGVVQTIIVILGDIYILGVKPENVGLIWLFALLSCIVFTIIIFTLVSLFGNVGKAIAVVIMVFQIAGVGGIYPIQTNPKIFEILQPLWPFTYAIDGFREGIAGPIWDKTYHDIKMLCLFGVVFLFLGLIKRYVYKITMFMEHKFKESGL